MSLKLDDATTTSLQNIIGECEAHLGKPLSKRVFYKDNTVYPKFKATTKLHERRQSRFGNQRDLVERRQDELAVKSVRGVGEGTRSRARSGGGYGMVILMLQKKYIHHLYTRSEGDSVKYFLK